MSKPTVHRFDRSRISVDAEATEHVYGIHASYGNSIPRLREHLARAEREVEIVTAALEFRLAEEEAKGRRVS